MADHLYVGQRVQKFDAAGKVTGRAVYGHDLVVPKMLYGKILYSRYAHARIRRIDTSRAERVPGVRAIVTAADQPGIKFGFLRDNLPLKGDKVRSLRDEVAAVAATSLDAAQEALQCIEVEYEELPAVFDPVEALREDAPLVHEEVGTNRIVPLCRTYAHGDIDEAFRRCDAVVEQEYRVQYVNHVSMGTNVCMAEFDDKGFLTFWSQTQMPFLMQKDLSEALGIPSNRVRIMQPTIGGAFGKHLDIYPNELICALLARKARRPVKIAFTRQEDFTAIPPRQPGWFRLRMGGSRDGRILANHIECLLDGGAYVSWGPVTPTNMSVTFANLYMVPNVRFDVTAAYTNNIWPGAMRGWGNPQATYVLECQVDLLARELGMDPGELRLKNANQPNQVSPQRVRITTCGLSDCLRKAMEDIGWKEKMAAPKRHGGSKARGLGIASLLHAGGGGRVFRSDGCGAIVKLDDFGMVTILTGSSEMGQGSDTALAQICAEELGVPMENIRLVNNDTSITPWDVGSHASRTTFIGGQAVALAARECRTKLFATAAEMLECSPEDLEARGGVISVKGHPTSAVPYDKVARSAHFRPQGNVIIGQGFFDPDTELLDSTMSGNISSAYTFAANAVEVEVDLETGAVEVLKIAASYDIGKVINPLGLEGQAEGGACMALGYALLEEMWVEEGQVRNPNLLFYRVPSSLDMPALKLSVVETADPAGPYGAKGIGECGAVSLAPAIANAVHDALGVRVTDLPLTSERVYRAIQQANLAPAA